MTWVSFRERTPPPPGAIFGFADKPGMTVACTNPGRPGATGWAASTATGMPARRFPCPAGRSPGRPRVNLLPTSAPKACVGALRQRGAARLSFDPHQRRSRRQAQRPHRRRSRVAGMFIPGWGMHLADISVAHGRPCRQVGAERCHWRSGSDEAIQATTGFAIAMRLCPVVPDG